MPAEKFTKKADTPAKRRQWDHVYKDALEDGDGKGSAIRQANAAVKRSSGGNSKMSKGGSKVSGGGRKLGR